MKLFRRSLTLAALALGMITVISCTTNQPVEGTAYDDMTVALHDGMHGNTQIKNIPTQPPSTISHALVPGIKLGAPQKNWMHRKFDIAVKDVPAATFYTGLFNGTPVNVAVSPDIKGNITLNMKQVTIGQVLQALENTYDYTYYPISGGYEILPNTMQTKIYTINYLELERRSNSTMSMSSGEVTQANTYGGSSSGSSSTGSSSTTNVYSGGSSNNNGQANASTASVIGNVQTYSLFNFWKELEQTLCNIVGAPNAHTAINQTTQTNTATESYAKQPTTTDPNLPSVTVNPFGGVVVVRAKPKELKQVETYLDIIQNAVGRQVILEAKILEITLKNQYQMGIDWKLFGAHLNALKDFPGTDIRNVDFPNAFSITATFVPQDFTMTLRALELQGNVQVLSSPKVSTMNNQMSAIKVGTDEFFATGITQNNNTTFVTGGVNGNQNQNIPNFSPFFSGITLDVTPQVDNQNNVTLHIHPAVSLVKEQIKTFNSGGGPRNAQSYPFAISTIRESDTIVHAKNGQVVVIGGLMSNATTEDVAQMPAFGSIPFLGTLLRNTKQQSQKTELVILLRATVVDRPNMNRQLAETTQRFAGAKRGFHIGGRPDIYGTEGEVPVVFGPAGGGYTHPTTK